MSCVEKTPQPFNLMELFQNLMMASEMMAFELKRRLFEHSDLFEIQGFHSAPLFLCMWNSQIFEAMVPYDTLLNKYN